MWRGGLSLAFVIAACGSSAIGPTDGAVDEATGAAGTMGGAGTTGAAGATGGAGGDTSHAPLCPPSVPQHGQPCTGSRRCSYYEAGFHPPCPTIAECDFMWLVTRPTATCGARAPACPATFAALAEGAACPANAGPCDYAEGRCACATCGTAGGAIGGEWSCRRWDTGGEGCPAASPVQASSCAMEGQFCNYGGFCTVSVGDDLNCRGGTWQLLPSPPGLCALPKCGP